MDRDDETQGDLTEAGDTGSLGPVGDEPAAAIGRIGRFVVLRRLGSGGMGVVYLAYDNDLDRKVAIKVLRRRHADDHATALRMQREAQAMARIAHPNVLRVYEVGVADERLHVAMEYVEGETLRASLARRGPPVDRAGVAEVLALFARAGAGLAAAHDAGLVHRDFKPDNVLLDLRGGVHVADFGLARAADGAEARPVERRDDEPRVDPRSALALDLTATRAVLGTPAYMPPEQHAGLALGVPADIFAFCVSLHEGLYGVRPFVGDSVDALAEAAAREQVRPPPPGSPVPPWLRAVVLRGLRSDPDARWPSMHALLAALADDPIARRRRRLGLGLGALALVAAVVAVALALRGQARRLDDQTARVGEIRVERDEARERAEVAARQARDLLRMAVLRDVAREPTALALVLAEVERPEATPGWLTTAQAVLDRPISAAILRGTGHQLLAASFLGEADEHVAVHTRDGRLRVHRRDGRGPATEFDLGVGLPAMVRLDRARVAAPIAGGRIGVWRLEGGALAPAVELAGAPARTSALVRDPSGRRLVALGTGSPRAVVWDLERGERLGELGCDDAPIRSADITRDGAHVLLAHDGATICVVPLGEPGAAATATIRGRVAGRFLPAGDVALLIGDELAELWSWRAGRRPRRIASDEALHRGLDPGGRRFATADFDGRVRLYDLDGGGAPVDLGSGSPDPPELLFSPDGAWLAAIGSDRVELWRTDELQRRAVLELPEIGAGPRAFSDDGRWFFADTVFGDLHVWPLEGLARELHVPAGDQPVLGLTSAPDDRTVAARVGSDVAWFEIPGGLAPVRAHRLDYVYTPAVDPAADLAAIAVTGRGDIALIDAAGRERALLGHRGPVWSLDFSRDARALLSASEDATARLWDLRTGAARLLAADSVPVLKAMLSPDAARAATRSEDGSLRLWDLRGADPLRGELLLAPDRGGALDFGFSPDGRWLVGLAAEAAAYLWDVQAEGPPRRLEHDGPPLDHCWEPAARWLAIGDDDGAVRVWDPRAEAPLQVHRGHVGPIERLACGPDGRSVAAASGLQVRLWPSDRPGDAELRQLDAQVGALVFTRDGRDLLIGTRTGVITRWTPRFHFTADAGELLVRLRAATTACLTPRQRERLLREPPELARERSLACERRFDRAP